MLELNKIKPRDHIKGIIPNSTVEIIEVKSHGDDCISVTFRYDENSESRHDERLLYKDDESRLEKTEIVISPKFDADSKLFRLVSEAFRIHLAYLFDTRLAVSISLVDPYPHQLTAVYQDMFPHQPLRFCLADDPGAGKTIMSGLYLKEMMMRDVVKRCLIVCPGNLVEQWQEELEQKFHIPFEIMTRDRYVSSGTGNPLDDNNFVISRLDQMSRNEDIQQRLMNAKRWDLIICDEAHKMAAHAYADKIVRTKRYVLGELLSNRTNNFLLLTATPHNGKEGDFQAFLALLDNARFAGSYREKDHKKDYTGLLRRVVKEDMLDFDGRKIFPERYAYTLKYELSELEQNLYDTVTNYVRTQFNKAERLTEGRRNVIGFALTVLQRRLASSPEAILSSLVNRRKRLEERLDQARSAGTTGTLQDEDGLLKLEDETRGYEDDDYDDLSDEERLRMEQKAIDIASAAQTIPELEDEIGILEDLVEEAKKVRDAGTDKKWLEVKKVIVDESVLTNPEGGPGRKLIIFTEHVATLTYLVQKLQALIGRKEAVVLIHGQLPREKRKYNQEEFIYNKNVQILVATDAAGEGVNLQRANLMINYDMPWNLNRIEQRFGRIHRINQKEKCYLWNLVADGTREGNVFSLLLTKLERQREALGDRVYNVLGSVYEGESLKKIMWQAITTKEVDLTDEMIKEIETPFDVEKIQSLLDKHALVKDTLDTRKIEKAREDYELAEAKKLQPHFIAQFFIEAFKQLGGSIKERESKRYEISNVPHIIQGNAENRNDRQSIQKSYERVTFEKKLINVEKQPLAEFICPGRPLLDSVIDLILQKYEHVLENGTVLVDPRNSSAEPYVLYYALNSIFDSTIDPDGNQHKISKQLNFISINETGEPSASGPAAYLDFRAPNKDEEGIVRTKLDTKWINTELENKCKDFANSVLVKKELDERKRDVEESIEKQKGQVQERLTNEIIFESKKSQELKMKELSGKKTSTSSGKRAQRVEELKARLENKMKQLEEQKHLRVGQASIIGRALVIPAGFFDKYGITKLDYSLDGRDEIERIAMKKVMEAEERIGRKPEDVSAQKLPYDITSQVGNGKIKFIEVKGKMKGKPSVTVSKNEILTYKNKPNDYILAIVMMDEDMIPETPRYVFNPYEVQPGEGTANLEVGFNVVCTSYNLKKLLEQSVDPQ